MLHDLFDASYYCQQAGQVMDAPAAWQHFQAEGDQRGLDPTPYFSTVFYKGRYPGWHRRGAATAFEDFLMRVSRGQLRQPHPLIDPAHYAAAYPDLADQGTAAALHFMRHGDAEGRSPGPGFDAGFYRRCYLPLDRGHPFRHHVTLGAAQGLLPRPQPRDARTSAQAMRAAVSGLARPLLLVVHDAQAAGVPILTLDLAERLQARGWDPVFWLDRAGPLLDRFRTLGPVMVVAEGWDPGGLAEALPHRAPALVTTAAAAHHAAALTGSGRGCVVLIHEMADYIRAQGLLPALRQARAAGAVLIASMPRMAADLAFDPGGVGQLLPGILPMPTPMAAFRRLRDWRRAGAGPVFIGAGHADRRKGFDLFLLAVRGIADRRPDARFIWLGALDNWARALADEALAEGVPLTLPGFVADSLAWYRAADVYLLTSRQDPGPTTAILAAAVGTPFVGLATDIGLVGLTEGIGTFLPPDDLTGYADAALALADQVTGPSRRVLRRHVRQISGFDRYVDGIIARLVPEADGAA